MKKALIIGFVIIISAISAFSQDSPLQSQKAPVAKLEPTVIVGDLVGVYQKLETVEIRGSEVDTYLTIKKQLTEFIETAKKKELKTTDNLKIEMELPMAQNLLNLMDRAVIQGAEAEGFQRFRQAFIDSAKKLQAK